MSDEVCGAIELAMQTTARIQWAEKFAVR